MNQALQRCLVAAWALLLATAGRAAETDSVDRMVAAGVVKVRAGAAAEAATGYGLVVSTGALVVVPATLVGADGKVVVEVKGERYLGEKVESEARGLAVCRVTIDGLNTVPIGSADTVQVGATVRALLPDGAGWKPTPTKVVTNGVLRAGRVKLRALEVDLPPGQAPPGVPLYSPDNGQVVGVVCDLGVGEAAVNLRAAAMDMASSILVSAGLALKPNLATDTAAVIGADGRLLDRFVNTWDFHAREPNLSASFRRALQYWQTIYGRFPDPLTQPMVDGDDLYFGDRGGALYALKLGEQRRSWISSDPGLMAFYPPLVSANVVAVPIGWIWTANVVDLADLAVQWDLWQQQARMGGEIAAVAARWRAQYGQDPLPWEQRALHFALYGAGAVVGLDRATGREKWRLPTGFVNRPILVGDRLYYGGLGIRGCATINDGQSVWAVGEHYGKFETTRSTWWHLAYAGSKLYYLAVPLWYGKGKDNRLHGSGECYLVEVDPATGRRVAEHDLFRLSYDSRNAERPLATFAVLDGAGTPKETLYCLVGQNLFRVNPANGEYKALKALDDPTGKRGFSTELAIKDGVVYIGTTNRELLAIDGETGQAVWATTPVLKGVVGSPTIDEGVLYVGSSDGYLHAFSATDGRELWWYEVGGKVIGQPLVVHEPQQDLLYAALDNGRLVAITLPPL